jgi:hypothetical protein
VRTDLPHRHLREVSEVIEVPFLVLRLQEHPCRTNDAGVVGEHSVDVAATIRLRLLVPRVIRSP